MKTVYDSMTKVPHSIEPHSSVDQAKKRMYELKVTHMPVLSGGKIIGLLSERDILYLKGLESVDLRDVKVCDAMIEEPVVVDQHNPLTEVCALMVERRVGSVLVQDKQEKLVGIFTDVDALKELATI